MHYYATKQLSSVFEVLKNWGHFDPLGLVSGGNFQILGVISYVMYIVGTSDVNKNATSSISGIDKCRKHSFPVKLSPLSFGTFTKYFDWESLSKIY